MDVYQLLKQDHREAKQLFNKINQTMAVNARAKLFHMRIPTKSATDSE